MKFTQDSAGIECPNCGQPLEMLEEEIEGEDGYMVVELYHKFRCFNCGKDYKVKYVPVEITSIKD